MKNKIKFNDLSKALNENNFKPEPSGVEIIGLIKNDTNNHIFIDLSMEGNNWVSVSKNDVLDDIENLGDKLVEIENQKISHPIVKFKLKENASNKLMWAVIQDIQTALESVTDAYEDELRKQGHTVKSGDSLISSSCSCNKGDKCCCPKGSKCCNKGKRCCCSS